MDFYKDIEKYNNNIAIVTENGEGITYKSIIDMSDCLFKNLTTRSLLFLVCKNCLESVCAYLGALRKGVVPLLIHSEIDMNLYKLLLKKYKPSYIFSPKDWDSYGMRDIEVFRSFSIKETNYDIDYKINDELALLLTTSGSTGSPKLVRQSYKNIKSNAKSISEYLEIDEKDRAITTMPMSYTFGLSIINSHLLRGASIVVNEHTLMNREFWSLLKNQSVTTFGGVPYIYEILSKLRFKNMDIPSIRYITQAGGKLSKELTEAFNEICAKKGIKFIVMYGQTEATARMTYLPWEMAEEKLGSIGTVIPGGEILLVDDDGEIIFENEKPGELVYRGDNVTLGYAESCYDLIKCDERKGTLLTGDIAVRDKDEYYYIVGRKKRFLKLYGKRVNLDEIEILLKMMNYECVCTGTDNQLIIHTTSKCNSKDLIIYISKITGINSSAFTVHFICEFPRNESGKILYSLLE